jgi:hypothetical protein
MRTMAAWTLLGATFTVENIAATLGAGAAVVSGLVSLWAAAWQRRRMQRGGPAAGTPSRRIRHSRTYRVKIVDDRGRRIFEAPFPGTTGNLEQMKEAIKDQVEPKEE